MKTSKTSKKALRTLINDSITEAVGHLQLPPSTKKVKKAIESTAKKLASVYSDILKKQEKKKRKNENALKKNVNGKATDRERKKVKKVSKGKSLEPVKI